MNPDQLAARLARYPRSPLFARLASEYLDAGRIRDARALCESGILEYPEYATAHLILAECHAAENRYRDAVDSMLRAEATMPDSLLFKDLREQWEELLVISPEVAAAQPPAGEDQPRPAELQASPSAEPLEISEASVAITEPRTIREAHPASVSSAVVDRLTIPSPSVHDRTEENRSAAEEVTPAREGVWEFSDEGRIVSKTVAEIYATQGAYDEAILTYRLLKRVRPELVPQIDRRIGELEGLSKVK